MVEIDVKDTRITVYTVGDKDFISLTDMIRAKDGDFFISDWLRNRNTVEFLGIWEQVHNPNFNYGGFAIIKSQAGLNNYKLSGRAATAEQATMNEPETFFVPSAEVPFCQEAA